MGLTTMNRAKTTGGGEKRAGLLSRTARGFGDVFFQLGISGPGRRWYKDSRCLSAKDKAVLDEELLGIF